MIQTNNRIGNILVDYTPDFYRRALRNYRNGDYKDLIALFEQTELDSHVMGCIEGREDGYKRDWRLTEASSAPRDIGIKDFVESVFMSINMRDLEDNIFDARKKKYVVIDLNWDIIQWNGESKQSIKPLKINQKYFRYDLKDNKLKLDFGFQLKEIPEDAALIVESIKAPILIPVARDFILKEFGLESFASFLETFGEPFIIGFYPPGSDPAFKNAVDEAVKNMAASSRGTAPDGTRFDIKDTQRGSADHDKFIEIAKKGISVSVLGHENAVSNQPGLQVGENQAPYKASRAKTIADIFFIEEAIYRLVKMLVDRNFDSVQKYPVFSIDKSEPINMDARLKIIDSAYAKGYEVLADEFALLGLKKSDTQAPILKRDFNNPADAGF